MPRFTIRYLFYSFLLILLVSSCGTQKTESGSGALYDPVQVARLSDKLGIELRNTDREDDKNMPLYAEISLWMGVPYRYGGLSRKGLDCSGFTFLMYQKVYKMKLPRSTSDLSVMKMQQVSKNNLRTGDLVFFATSKKSKQINHVGIYLKNGRFIHASTSRGVIVSRLDEDYYSRTWRKGGRVR